MTTAILPAPPLDDGDPDDSAARDDAAGAVELAGEVLVGEIVTDEEFNRIVAGKQPPPLRSAYLDPRTLIDNPRHTRTKPYYLEDLKASIPVVGIRRPLVLVPAEGTDGGWQVVIGHRLKYAAIELDMPLVPCMLAADEGAAAQILAQLIDNAHHLGLTATEEAEGYHQLTLLDWTPEQIANARAIATATVRHALTLRQLPQTARDAVDEGTLNLEDAAALREFADSPATQARILKAGPGWSFRHALANERSKRDFAKAKERAKAELVLADVKVTSKPKGWGYNSVEVDARHLADADGKPLDPQQVRAMPGFAAFVEKVGSQANTVVYCTDPGQYGYSRAKPTHHHGRALTDEEITERDELERQHAEFLEALIVAATVRRDFIRTTYGTAKAAKGLFLEALRQAVTGTHQIRFADVDGLYTALGGTDHEVLAQGGEDRLRRGLVARWVCAHERNLGLVTDEYQWDLDKNAVRFWYEQLVADAYTLADAEVQLLQSFDSSSHDDEDDDGPEDDADPHTDEHHNEPEAAPTRGTGEEDSSAAESVGDNDDGADGADSEDLDGDPGPNSQEPGQVTDTGSVTTT